MEQRAEPAAMLKNCLQPSEEMPDRIADFFASKHILLTGVTGYLGKVFLEKLLRTCPDVARFYLLIRPKKGKEPADRIKDLSTSNLFDKVKELRGNDILMKKCQAIAGDVTQDGLGLEPEDRKLLTQQVQLIYHCAASVRFDEPLRQAVLLNTRGTRLMLELAADCQRLQMFCHVSTAYCNLNQKILEEKAYPPPADPHKVIKAVEWMSNETVEAITKHLLGDIPNTYSYTKALSEALVTEQMDKLPVMMVRPSIVIPMWKEPLPGWTDNINGLTGILIGAGKGLVRTMHCDPFRSADFLPVDIAANLMAVSAWDFVEHNKERKIFNLTTSNELKITWNELIEMGKKTVRTKMPLNNVLWYPGGTMRSNKLTHMFCLIFFHVLPAILVDALLLCLGYKPVLWRVQKRITKGIDVVRYYANNQWHFKKDNTLKLEEIMNDKEKSIHQTNLQGLDIEDFFTVCTHGARKYVLKETDDTIPAAKRHMRVMWWVDKITQLVFLYGVLYFLYGAFQSFYPIIV